MTKENNDINKFKRIVWSFYNTHRRDLPWRKTRNSYRILVSEIMLQQTQVERVIPFYNKFIKKFPSFSILSRARKRSVLLTWQGLGYNRRALYLREIARIVVSQYKGKLPKQEKELMSLPGIGKGTAGSLQVFVFNIPAIFIETNIRRAYIDFFFHNAKNVSDAQLFPFVKKTLDHSNARDWYSALMDYGSMISKIKENPNHRSNTYRKQPVFSGSQRELRGKILRLLLKNPKIKNSIIASCIKTSSTQVNKIRKILKKEGFSV